MADLTFSLNSDTGLYEAEATTEGGRFALHLEFEDTTETRTREVQVEVEVDVLDPETNEPTGEKTTEVQTQTQNYTVPVNRTKDNLIAVGRSASGENYSIEYRLPFSGEVYDETFDGVVAGMGILVACKYEPVEAVILG